MSECPSDHTASIDRSHSRRQCATTTMDAQLLALAKAQDDFRQQVAVGLTDLKSIYDACAREHGNELKQRANEQESARRAIEGANAERDRLEQKLVQCEHALSETKHALVETREKAKDVRACDACARESSRCVCCATREFRKCAISALLARDAV